MLAAKLANAFGSASVDTLFWNVDSIPRALLYADRRVWYADSCVCSRVSGADSTDTSLSTIDAMSRPEPMPWVVTADVPDGDRGGHDDAVARCDAAFGAPVRRVLRRGSPACGRSPSRCAAPRRRGSAGRRSCCRRRRSSRSPGGSCRPTWYCNERGSRCGTCTSAFAALAASARFASASTSRVDFVAVVVGVRVVVGCDAAACACVALPTVPIEFESILLSDRSRGDPMRLSANRRIRTRPGGRGGFFQWGAAREGRLLRRRAASISPSAATGRCSARCSLARGSRCRPAAGSALSSGWPSRPRSRHPGCGCARPTGSRWSSAGS